MARIAIVRQYYYPLDPRVRREADALADAGHEVEVLCLRRAGEPAREQVGRVHVVRLPLTHRRGGVLRYLAEYALFFGLAGTVLTARHLRRRYHVVQVNTLPDFLVFAALIARMTGARVVLDLHECMPEFFATKFHLDLRHPVVRLVAWIEQLSIRFSSVALTCTDQQRERFVSRGAPEDKVTVILNGSDESVFRPPDAGRPQTVTAGLTLMSHGSVEKQYGLDTLIRAAHLVRQEIHPFRVLIYGDGSQLPELRRLVNELDLGGHVQFSGGFVPLGDLVAALASADAGVVPTRRDEFRDLILTNKMYDFVAMVKPVITSRTPSVEAYFDEDCFRYFNSGDDEDLARAIRELHTDPELRGRLAQRAARVSEPYRWVHQSRKYVELVERLLAPRSAGA